MEDTYGVYKGKIFQVNDLYEKRNIHKGSCINHTSIITQTSIR